ISPFQVHLVPIPGKDDAQIVAAEAIYRELTEAGLEVLMDDREERAGVKFKDPDLLGCPIRITIGQGLVKDGVVEIRERATRQDRKGSRAEVRAPAQEIALPLPSPPSGPEGSPRRGARHREGDRRPARPRLIPPPARPLLRGPLTCAKVTPKGGSAQFFF